MLNIGYCFSSGVYYEHHNPHCINVQKIDDAITQSHKKGLGLRAKEQVLFISKSKAKRYSCLFVQEFHVSGGVTWKRAFLS